MTSKFKEIDVVDYMDYAEKCSLSVGDRFVMRITPEYAKMLMEIYNMVNREIKWSRVKKYATEMRCGEWRPDVLLEGAIYYVDENGQFVSAQHRIQGAVEANFTIEEAIFVVVDRQTFYDKSGEKRNKKDRALMDFKVIDRDTDPVVSEALLYLLGQRTSLKDPKNPCFTKIPSKWSSQEMKDLHEEFSETLNSLLFRCGDTKITRNLFSVLACYLYVGIIDFDTALNLVVNKHLLKFKGGSGYLTFSLAVLDYLGIENKFNPNERGPGPATKAILLTHNPAIKKKD